MSMKIDDNGKNGVRNTTELPKTNHKRHRKSGEFGDFRGKITKISAPRIAEGIIDQYGCKWLKIAQGDIVLHSTAHRLHTDLFNVLI